MTGALGATLALLLWGAAPAAAGGSTSVFLASPESQETASLYYSDEEYGELDRLLGPGGRGTRDKPPEADLMASHQISVTWMAHDVTPWRLDRVYEMDDGRNVWIHTAVGRDQPTNGTWHRAEQPAQLRTLFKDLGLMSKTSAGGSAAAVPPESEASGDGEGAQDSSGIATDTTDTATEAPLAQSTGSGDGTDWWWALPGAAAGAVLALVLRPFATRLPLTRLRGEPGPRQELRDV
ncbi:hypothetical protein ACFQ6E_32765 [Streptomyces sp. NPDC056462]|uniref:hypothetical protein n=1 Tax=Streptomyces sp. NPDC056462 TaxID=3345826 RepID=UPI0036B2C839